MRYQFIVVGNILFKVDPTTGEAWYIENGYWRSVQEPTTFSSDIPF